jgi:hypothetical protein
MAQARTGNIAPNTEGIAMRARKLAIGSASVAAFFLAMGITAASGQTIPVPVPDPPTGDVPISPSQPTQPPPAVKAPVVEPPKAVSAVKTERAASSTSFALRLRDGSRLVGVPSESKNLSFQATFGRIEIPLSLVKSIAFGPDPAAAAVGFHNGDRLTGAVVDERMRFQTAYGTVDVPMSTVVGLAAADATPTTTAPKASTPAPAPAKDLPAPRQVAAPAAPLDAPR